MRNTLNKILLCVFVINLSACSFFVGEDGIFRDRKKDYRKAESLPRIEIPDGLDDQAIVDLYPVPPISPFSDGEMIDEFPLPIGIVHTEVPVKVQKIGDIQWVLLQASASQVWPRLKEFLSDKGLLLTVENGAAGMIEAKADAGLYRFRIEQGFQRNTSELYVRFIDSRASVTGFWPEVSTDINKEQEMIGDISRFFADVSDKPSYSFAAQGISTQKKIALDHDEQGNKTLILYVKQLRAWLTVKQSLEKADFKIENVDEPGQKFLVQYMPPLSPDKQPGAFKRFFGVKPKPFDKDVKFAGEKFEFGLLASNGDQARLFIKAMDVEDKTAEEIRKEQNYMLLILKEHLY